jgi:hypothetical protein
MVKMGSPWRGNSVGSRLKVCSHTQVSARVVFRSYTNQFTRKNLSPALGKEPCKRLLMAASVKTQSAHGVDRFWGFLPFQGKPSDGRSRRKPDITFAAVNVGVGRIARLQRSPWEGPESAPKPPFHCEREIGFTARGGSSVCAINRPAASGAITQISASIRSTSDLDARDGSYVRRNAQPASTSRSPHFTLQRHISAGGRTGLERARYFLPLRSPYVRGCRSVWIAYDVVS